MEENQNSQKIVRYSGQDVMISEPSESTVRETAYIRPGDNIVLNFNIENIKVDVVGGDVHIIFPSGGTITLASFAALAFSAGAPKIISTVDESEYTLDEFLTTTQVLNYDEAILILVNKDEYSLQESRPDVIQEASDQDSTLTDGTPITGVGSVDFPTEGLPKNFVDINAIAPTDNAYTGAGNFVTTIYTTNLPFNLDEDSLLPGDVEIDPEISFDSEVLYGSELIEEGQADFNDTTYNVYGYNSGLGFSNDPYSMLAQNDIDLSGSSSDVFVRNSSQTMKYQVDIKYGGGIFPARIDILVPKNLHEYGFTLEGLGGGVLNPPYEDADGNWVYPIPNLDPSGEFKMGVEFPAGQNNIFSNLTYRIFYFNPSTGELESVDIVKDLQVSPVNSEIDIESALGDIFANSASPANVKTGSGNDIILVGGSGNVVSSGSGDDHIFTGVGNDDINFGAGKNSIWGSSGVDIYNGGASGENTIYYNNFNAELDPEGENFDPEYYNTFSSTASIFNAFIGFDEAELRKQVGGLSEENLERVLGAISANSNIIYKNSSNLDVLNNINYVYFTRSSDNVTVSDKHTNEVYHLFGGDVDDNVRGNRDTINIAEDFVDAVYVAESPDHESGDVLLDSSGEVRYHIADFNIIRGSSNNETFYANYGTTPSPGVIREYDGGDGVDTISYDNFTDGSIEYRADADQVTKNKGSETPEIDRVRNMENFQGTQNADTYYGSLTRHINYDATNNTGDNDTLSYQNAVTAGSGVALILADNEIYKDITIDFSDPNYKDNAHDTFTENINVVLSSADDLIISDDTGNYNINANIGEDTLTYEYLTDGIEVNFADGELNSFGSATVNKAGGGVDTFNLSVDSGEMFRKNISIIQGTSVSNIFNMHRGKSVSEVYTLIGHKDASVNRIDYSKVASFVPGEKGLSVSIQEGDRGYVQKTGGGIDNFMYITEIIGSNADDSITFQSNITSIDEISKYTFDMGDGLDTADFSLLSTDLVDGGSTAVRVTFGEGGTMSVEFGTGTGGEFTPEPGSETEFANTEGVVGTINDDYLTATQDTAINFRGSLGFDTADYSEVSADLEFDMTKNAENVSKGSVTDTLSDIEKIIGGTGNNTFLLGANASYVIEGNANAASNILSYAKSTAGVVVDFANQEVTKGAYIDEFQNITEIVGSFAVDTFIAYTSDSAVSQKVNGGSNLTNIIDFSRIEAPAEGLDITVNSIGQDTPFTFEYGNVTWEFIHINTYIATVADDNFKLQGLYSYTIDGNEGHDIIDYSTDTEIQSVRLVLEEGALVTKSFAGGNFSDRLTNIEEIKLTNNDDIVSLTDDATDKYTTIDAGGNVNPFGDTLSFALYTASDVILRVVDSEGSNQIEIVEGFPEISFIGFNALEGSSSVNLNVEIDSDLSGSLQVTSREGGSTIINIGTGSNSSVTLTLATATGANDTLSGDINADNLNFVSVRSTAAIEYRFGDGDITVFGSTLDTKVSKFIGGAGNNTLSYENTPVSGGYVRIDLDAGTVGRSLTNFLSFDTFENFSTVKGTNRNDEVIIRSAEAIDIAVDLLGQGTSGGDRIIIDPESAKVSFNVGSNEVSIDDAALSLDNIVGAEIMELSQSADTVIIDDTYTNNSAYVEISGGKGDDVLDATEITSSGIVFNSQTGQFTATGDQAATPIGDIVWDNSLLTNFVEVKGSNTKDNTFFGSSTFSYTFRGGAEGNDTLSYQSTPVAVVIDLGKQEVTKRHESKDLFFDIENIIGSNGSDKLVLSDSESLDYLNNLQVDLQADNTIDSSDEMIFQLSSSVAFEINENDTAMTINETRYTPNFKNIDVYRFSNAQDNSVDVNFSVNYELLLSGQASQTETITYSINDDILFDGLTETVSRLGADGSTYVDTIQNFNEVVYTGTGNATFNASMLSYRYDGGTDAASVVVDYSINLVEGIRVEFSESDDHEVIKTSGASDFLGNGITEIRGTDQDDIFVLVERSSGVITIDGKGGAKDVVSFEKLFPEGSEFKTGDFGAVDSYVFVNINSFGLTKGDDTYKAEADKLSLNVSIDGLDGNDTLDYTALSATDSVNIEFIGDGNEGIVYKNNADGFVGNDNFYNFENFITGDGDDIFILNDTAIDVNIDAGGGNNTLDLDAVSHGMTAVFGKDDIYGVDITYNGDTTIGYNNMRTIKFGAEVTQVDYHYQAEHSTGNVHFESALGGSASKLFAINAASLAEVVLNYNAFTTTLSADSTQFSTIAGFSSFAAEGATVLSITTDGNTRGDFKGGNTNKDKIDYSAFTEDVTLKIDNVSADSSKIEFLRNEAGSVDLLENIETIVLGSGVNTVELIEITDTVTDPYLTIDGGISGLNVISLAGYVAAVNIDFGSDGINLNGYELKNFSKFSLTSHDDTASVVEDLSLDLSGGDGHDKIDYARATSGVAVTLLQGTELNVAKNNFLFSDLISDFEEITLTGFDDTFEFEGEQSETGAEITIDFGEGNDAVSYRSFTTDTGTREMKIQQNDVVVEYGNKKFTFLNLESLTGSELLSDTFIIDSLDTSITSIDGASVSGDIIVLNTADDVVFDLGAGVLTKTDNDKKITFAGITEITGGTGNNVFELRETDSNALASSFIIKGNESAASTIVSYASSDGSIDATIGADGITVTKSNSLEDTLTNITEIRGTSYNDTFRISELVNGMTISSQVGAGSKKADFTNLSGEHNLSLVDANEGNLTKFVIENENFTLNNITHVVLGSEMNLVVNMLASANTSSIVIEGAGGSTLDLSTTTALDGNSTVIDIINGSVYSTGVEDGFFLLVSEIGEYIATDFDDLLNIDISDIQGTTSVTLLGGYDTVDFSGTKSAFGSEFGLVLNDGTMSGTFDGLTIQGFESITLTQFDDVVSFSLTSMGTIEVPLVIDGYLGTNTFKLKDSDEALSLLLIENSINIVDGADITKTNVRLNNFSRIDMTQAGSATVVNIVTGFFPPSGSLEIISSAGSTLNLLGSISGGDYTSKVVLDIDEDGGSNFQNISLVGFSTYNLGTGDDEIIMTDTIANDMEINTGGGLNKLIISDSTAVRNVSVNLEGTGAYNTSINESTASFTGVKSFTAGTGGTSNLEITAAEAAAGGNLRAEGFTHSNIDVNYTSIDSIVITETQMSVINMANQGVDTSIDYALGSVDSLSIYFGYSAELSGGSISYTSSGLDTTPEDNYVLDIVVSMERNIDQTFILVGQSHSNTGENRDLYSQRIDMSGFVVIGGGATGINVTLSSKALSSMNVTIPDSSVTDFYNMTVVSGGNTILELYDFEDIVLTSKNDTFTYDSSFWGANSINKSFSLEAGGGSDTLEITSPTGGWSVSIEENGEIHRTKGGETIIDYIGNFENVNVQSVAESEGFYEGRTYNASETYNSDIKYSFGQDENGNAQSFTFDRMGAANGLENYNDFINVTFSQDRDLIKVYGMQGGKIIDTGKGDDDILLLGEAANFNLEHYTDEYVWIDGEKYHTGGSYVKVIDEHGNVMYFFNTDLDDFKSGGNVNNNKEKNNDSDSFSYNSNEDKADSNEEAVNNKEDIKENDFVDNSEAQDANLYLNNDQGENLYIDNAFGMNLEDENISFDTAFMQEVSIEDEKGAEILAVDNANIFLDVFVENETLDEMDVSLTEASAEDNIEFTEIAELLPEEAVQSVHQEEVESSYKLSDESTDVINSSDDKSKNNNGSNNGFI